MKKGFPVFVSITEGSCLIEMQPHGLKQLIAQTAACVIECCENYSIGPDGGVVPLAAPIGRFLKYSLKWREQEVINALQAQVEFLYTFVGEVVASRGKTIIAIGIEKRETNLIAKALELYQKYKTAICEAEQKKYGQHWGSGTSFFQADWTDLNKEFLALFK